MSPEDLSHHHHPLTDLFSRAVDDKTVSLSEDAIEQFEAVGFTAGHTVLSTEQLEVLRA